MLTTICLIVSSQTIKANPSCSNVANLCMVHLVLSAPNAYRPIFPGHIQKRTYFDMLRCWRHKQVDRVPGNSIPLLDLLSVLDMLQSALGVPLPKPKQLRQLWFYSFLIRFFYSFLFIFLLKMQSYKWTNKCRSRFFAFHFERAALIGISMNQSCIYMKMLIGGFDRSWRGNNHNQGHWKVALITNIYLISN